MSRKIQPEPLTAEKFRTFGDVIEADAGETRSINEGNTTRFHDLADLDLTEANGRPTLSIFRSTPLPTPLQLTLMERHPRSSQAFYPLGDAPYLVVVAPPGGLDPAAIRVFLAQPGQGVNYHRGVWHHYSLALGQVSDFLVIDRDGPDDNCDEMRLDEPLEIDLE